MSTFAEIFFAQRKTAGERTGAARSGSDTPMIQSTASIAHAALDARAPAPRWVTVPHRDCKPAWKLRMIGPMTTLAPAAKETIYREARTELAALLDGVYDPVAAMASAASVLHHRIERASWTGFYRVVAPGLLRIGPYQGLPGCLEIPFDRGVCGAAARTGESQVVADVHAFPGHIACDDRARSEIVVPVRDRKGELVAVLDVDSHHLAAFDDDDRLGLESIAELLSGHL